VSNFGAVSRTSLRSVFPSRFPGSYSSLAASLSESSSGWTQVCPQPLLITVQQNPLTAVLLRQVLDIYKSLGRSPDYSGPHSPRGSRACVEPRCVVPRPQRRVNSGKLTTPVDYGSTEPPGRRPPAPGPQLYQTPQAVTGLLRTSLPSRLPGFWLSPSCWSLGHDAGRTLVCPEPLLIAAQQSPLVSRGRVRSRFYVPAVLGHHFQVVDGARTVFRVTSRILSRG